jgi:hypothetical protein
MWPRRFKVAAALVPLAFLVTSTAPGRHSDVSRHPDVVTHRASLRPVVIARETWHADEKAVRGKPLYDRSVKAVFVHHTDNPNDYDCATDVPAMLLAIEENHVHTMGWDDLGYNFVVDRCGNIYEAGPAASTGMCAARTPRASTSTPSGSPPSGTSVPASRCRARCWRPSPP